jgi:integrase/recombinase XerD
VGTMAEDAERWLLSHIIHGYRDSLVLLLRFLSVRHKWPIAELDLKDLEPTGILAFLSHLEKRQKRKILHKR